MTRNSRFSPVLLSAAALLLALPVLAQDEADPAQPQPGAHSDDAPAESTEALVARLVEQLGDKSYALRKQAQDQLEGLGLEAFDALNEAQSHPDLEIAARARYLVQVIRVQLTREDDPIAIKQLLKDYGSATDAVRLARMQQLAALPEGEGVSGLVRLVRFEKSPLLSKQGALLVIDRASKGKLSEQQANMIERSLGSSQRAASQWLRALAEKQSDPAAAVNQFAEFLAAESKALAQGSADTNRTIVTALTRRQVEALRALKRAPDAGKLVEQLVAEETGEPDSLRGFMTWATEQKDFATLDQLDQKFADKIAASPMLLYTLAEARLKQGNEGPATELANKALAISPANAMEHIDVAFRLQREGMIRWAEAEYRHVMGITEADSYLPYVARYQLAEMLHDQLRDKEAAEIMQQASEAANKDSSIRERAQASDRFGVDTARARFNFFYACHYEEQGDTAKQIEHLDKAIRADRLDADVLIAMYRLPEQTDERRKSTLGRIRQAASIFHDMIRESPDEPTGYNQYAWLIGNTEGDLDEAIRFSQKSLELRPGTGGYLDTLAHCYFTKGDFENAVRYQRMAAELDQHSGQIQRALAKFETSLAEQKKAQ